MFFEHKKKHAALGRRDGLLEWLAVFRQSRIDRIKVVVQIFVVNVFGFAGLEIQTLFARWRRSKGLKEAGK
jgi:hypothetical protein